MRGAGGVEENPGGARRRLPRLNIWNKQKNQHEEDRLDSVLQEDQEEEKQQEEQLEEISRRLILREEELFSLDVHREDEEDQLQRDIENLRIQIWITVHNTFTSSASRDLEVLRSAVASIQQQEEQDQRWKDCPKDQVPVWRPQRWLSTHNQLLQKMVESRLSQAAEENSRETDQLSSAVKKQVCRMGKRVKDDLLTVVTKVKSCYPAKIDILNVYAGLYHHAFSVRLAELTAADLEINDCSYLLFWVNHYYPREILKHKELDGLIKTACLGSLLQEGSLSRLEEQYLIHREEQIKLWLSTALKKEQESWLSEKAPEVIDSYYFSPLAIDVIQVVNSSLTEFSHTIKDQNKAQRLLVQLENFLCSYKKCLEDFVKGALGNVHAVIKAQLVCEQQLRDYITHQTGSLSEEQRRRCLDSLSAVRDCGYRCFTCPLHDKTKACLSQLWTSVWADGSLPVVDLLLDHLNQQLVDLADLKPACRQSLCCVLHQNMVLQYVKKMMKTRNKNREQQVAGAQRMIEDAQKLDRFFTEEGCRETSWLCVLLCSLAEVIRLQDPASIQLELVNLSRSFPDLSGPHVSALLSLKTGLSAADIRSIRLSVEENRLLDASTNQRPPFFSRIKVKWINNKMNQMGLKS
ncbi:tumor necrosis factor alpha-induced protein 2a [Kryptolebias marmoratus]|uniref:tumor necrosis factor alpha-induced protein 2a n=1 Tax=Kryptolebias marmoratus TaxID=37003 RepID=UPI0007F86EDB|nr:tumor necrosis factor alpha-induced protein 2a [Kryptolebias marmoratus]